MSEFFDLITFDEEIFAKQYLYIIEPVVDDSSIQDWEGGLKILKRKLKSQEDRLTGKLNQIQEDFKTNVNTKIDTIQTSMDAQKKEI